MTIEDGLVAEMVKVQSMREESTTPEGARKHLAQLSFTVRIAVKQYTQESAG